MTNPKFWQDHEFDAGATFIVASWRPGFTHMGAVPRNGDVFDKTGVRPDRLRSLFESRWIRMAGPGEIPAAPAELDRAPLDQALASAGFTAEKPKTKRSARG